MVAHEIGHVLGMWHSDGEYTPYTDTYYCEKNGFMSSKRSNGGWWNAEEWGNCAELDLKGMYNYYINKRGYNWCLTPNGEGNIKISEQDCL